jgi:pantothenate kinase
MLEHPTPQRAQVLLDLLELVVAVRPRERAVVGIDGPDGVGKSTLTAELLALAPMVSGREVLGVGVDGFHHPREVRYAHGRDAAAYYEHAFDYDALRRCVLEPFRQGREIVPAVRDVARDEPVFPDPVEATGDALLLVEGVFLRRPELEGSFDATVVVAAPLEVTVPRGNARFDAPPEHDHPGHPANARYVGAQQRYRYFSEQVEPTWIVDNTDLDRPVLLTPDPDEPGWGIPW